MAVGEKLWARGDGASSFAIVEKGYLAIYDGENVLGIAMAGTVLGESAIFGLLGAPVSRTADVSAMTPVKVSEFPVAVLKEGFTVGTAGLILRTLFGQISRNSLLVMAAHPNNESLTLTMTGFVQAIASADPLFAKIEDWPAFVETFQVLFELREASDRMRRALTTVPASAAELERATQIMKDLFKRPESIEYLQPFLDVERERKAGQKA
jgi:CRP-like cAMP-binding protein